MENMSFNMFLLVNVRPDAISRPFEELRQIPGITRVVEVSGVYDFLVEIEATAHFTRISDTLMAKPWVKRVHVLRPMRADNALSRNSHVVESTTDFKEKTEENHQTPTQSWLHPII